MYRTVKEINDNIIKEKIDFLIFFTAKEELLSFSETTKKLYIKDINKQIIGFSDFKSKLLSTLNVKNLTEFNKLSGIIVVDNFETIHENEKGLFFDFIKQLPRSIQFVITSRNEEPCEDKINLREFSDLQRGIKFIEEYLDYYELKISLKENEIIRLIELSKGNTLIIVLSLQLVSNNHPIDSIFTDLESVEEGNIEVISDFMYKNSIESAIKTLETAQHKPIEILKVISLYDVPVDIYSLSRISGQMVKSVEEICEFLTSKLILEKIGETYKPNEFANKFIISRYIPNRVELRRLKDKIREHQKELADKLKRLETARKKEPLLDGIMEDWKPKNSIDKVAISEAFNLFRQTKKFVSDNNNINFDRIDEEFGKLEKMTSHPYIRFQKARCFQLLLEIESDETKRTELMRRISEYYEEAIDITDFYYPFIKNTKSYASINWIYGIFLSSVVGDIEKSLRYLEDSVLIFRRVGVKDKSYFTAINNLSWVYSKLYEKEHDKLYLEELKPYFHSVKSNKNYLLSIGFNYKLYIQNFGKYFRKEAKR